MTTDYNVRCVYRDGKWGEIEVTSDVSINLTSQPHACTTVQEAFEGLKGLPLPRRQGAHLPPDENAARLQSTCRGHQGMPEVPIQSGSWRW